MQAPKPDYVTIGNRRVKVQQWQQLPDRVMLATLVHGDASGNDLLALLREETVSLEWEGTPPVQACPEVRHHRAAGTGPKTVHRIEATLWLPVVPASRPEQSMEVKLDRILHELQMLRAEVAELRGQGQPGTSAISAPLIAGRTLLDFNIETDDNA